MAMYSFSFDNVAVTAVQDLFQIEANGTPAIIHGVYVSQSTDVGDSEEELLRIRIRKSITDAVTDDVNATQADDRTRAEAANLAVNETTQITTGAENYHVENWNIRQTFIYLPTPEMRPTLEDGEALTVDLADAPADSITCSGTLYFEQ